MGSAQGRQGEERSAFRPAELAQRFVFAEDIGDSEL